MRLSEDEIEQYLKEQIINEHEMQQFMDENNTILCSHKQDAHSYNHQLLHKMLAFQHIINVIVASNVNNTPKLQEWLQHQIKTMHAIIISSKKHVSTK